MKLKKIKTLSKEKVVHIHHKKHKNKNKVKENTEKNTFKKIVLIS